MPRKKRRARVDDKLPSLSDYKTIYQAIAETGWSKSSTWWIVATCLGEPGYGDPEKYADVPGIDLARKIRISASREVWFLHQSTVDWLKANPPQRGRKRE